MNLILFSIFVIGIICIMSGYYGDKISKESTTTIKYIPQYSDPKIPNMGSKLHDFYNTIFSKADKWTTYPYDAADGLEFPKMKSVASTDFMGKWTWPSFTRDKSQGAPIYDINKKLSEKSCTADCHTKYHIHEKSLVKHQNSKLIKCKNKCSEKLF